LFFWFIGDTKSKRTNFLKPCGRTTLFSAGLHRQAQNQRLTELARYGVFSALPLATPNKGIHTEIFWCLQSSYFFEAGLY
jgi:hypothetical protein